MENEKRVVVSKITAAAAEEGDGAPCTNRYTSVNDLEISPGSVREVPEICGICRRIFYFLLAYVMRRYIYDSRSCVRD